ncbi:MAG TPA: hypothetical protein VHO70_14725 [Chitinispirillaceae bacterium]|nr:hypothetical protein [Chitinispirillaceae bacterium]
MKITTAAVVKCAALTVPTKYVSDINDAINRQYLEPNEENAS